MFYSHIGTFALAILAPLVSGHVEERATSCLKCGGCAFTLKASGSSVSYLNGASLGLTPFASPQSYDFGSFGSPGLSFKLDSTCRLVASSSNMTAQVFSGTDNKNHPLYFNKGIATVGGKKLVEATCSISTASSTLNQLTCPKAGSESGFSFYTSRGTTEAGQYEIGQDLLVLAKSSDVSSGYTTITLTAVQA